MGTAGRRRGPVVALAVGSVVYRYAVGCGTPGDSGGCKLGVFATVMASVPVGAGLFALVALVFRIVRRRRVSP